MDDRQAGNAAGAVQADAGLFAQQAGGVAGGGAQALGVRRPWGGGARQVALARGFDDDFVERPERRLSDGRDGECDGDGEAASGCKRIRMSAPEVLVLEGELSRPGGASGMRQIGRTPAVDGNFWPIFGLILCSTCPLTGFPPQGSVVVMKLLQVYIAHHALIDCFFDEGMMLIIYTVSTLVQTALGQHPVLPPDQGRVRQNERLAISSGHCPIPLLPKHIFSPLLIAELGRDVRSVAMRRSTSASLSFEPPERRRTKPSLLAGSPLSEQERQRHSPSLPPSQQFELRSRRITCANFLSPAR